jgi:hypothetical protein
MAFNGSGTFNRIYNWVTDKGNSVAVTASRMDAEQDGIATGLSNCITKDGQTTISANIPFNSKKITGLGNGSARTDSIALGQVQDGTYTTLGTVGGSADTYTASPTPVLTAYPSTIASYTIKINADNTGASTLNVNALGAKDIKKYDGSGAKLALIAGELQQDQIYNIVYDGTDFIVLELTKRIGDTVQADSTSFGAVATGTTIVPNDDTIPQITEGDEYMTKSITPTNSSNKLRIRIVAPLTHSTAGTILIGALYQDSTSDALKAVFSGRDAGVNSGTLMVFEHFMTAGTTSTITFRFRAGSSNAGTTTFNGIAGGRKFGGVSGGLITIEEIQV